MAEPHIKQFPDLMKGKKILYVHGFASSGQSGTVTRIGQVFPNAKVIAPDLPLQPQDAVALLQNVCKEERPDLIIGTSMGGMYAEMLAGFDRILVNPAFAMGDTMVSHNMVGAQRFANPRRDGVQEFIVTKALVKEYKDITAQCFQRAEEDGKRVFGLFGDEDSTVDTRLTFERHYPQSIPFHGGHRMNDNSFMDAVVPVIRWIDDSQEGRERPIVYIDFNSAVDNYGKPRSSMQKAVRLLIESYNVLFVSQALAGCPKEMEDKMKWCEEYLSVPAHDRVLFTNQRNLLYGDYLIAADANEDASNFLGTFIQFGTDTYKTWEDIIGYFTLLGGQ